MAQSIVALNLGNIALRILHLLRRGSAAGVLAVLAALLSRTIICAYSINLILFIAGADHVNLLANLNWSLSNTRSEIAVAGCALTIGEDVLLVACALVEGITILQI